MVRLGGLPLVVEVVSDEELVECVRCRMPGCDSSSKICWGVGLYK